MFEVWAFIVAVAACVTALHSRAGSRQLKRAEFIRTYRWPRGLLDKLSEKHPGITRKDAALVSRGLRQFFIAYLMSDRNFVSMPSQVADDLWHEFILYTREYQEFCRRAFGAFLHHTPAVVLAPAQRSRNEGLRRVWWYACKYENINPYQPTRLPLLFALDAKLKVLHGFRYELNCDPLRRDGMTNVYCAAELADRRVDGSIDGFDDRRRHGLSGGCGGGGGGEGGGCGGGCGS